MGHFWCCNMSLWFGRSYPVEIPAGRGLAEVIPAHFQTPSENSIIQTDLLNLRFLAKQLLLTFGVFIPALFF